MKTISSLEKLNVKLTICSEMTLMEYLRVSGIVNFGNNYREYILGDEKTVVSRSTKGFGQAVIEQKSKWVNITLNHRVCA